jgi:hypothetical protein
VGLPGSRNGMTVTMIAQETVFVCGGRDLPGFFITPTGP